MVYFYLLMAHLACLHILQLLVSHIIKSKTNRKIERLLKDRMRDLKMQNLNYL